MTVSTSSRLRVALLSAALTAALPLGVRAQLPAQPPIGQSPGAQARKEITDARVEMAKDKQLLELARKRVEAGFGKENPGYATAQKTFEKAQADLKSVTSAGLASLKSKPEYLDAIKAKQAAKDKQAALAADPKATEDDRQAIFNEVVAQAKIVNDMEAAVTLNDPKIVDAKQRLADAKQSMDDFKSKIDAACAADPEYQQAFQAEASAEQRLTQAQASYAQQQKAAAEAAAAAARSRTPPPAAPGGQ